MDDEDMRELFAMAIFSAIVRGITVREWAHKQFPPEPDDSLIEVTDRDIIYQGEEVSA